MFSLQTSLRKAGPRINHLVLRMQQLWRDVRQKIMDWAASTGLRFTMFSAATHSGTRSSRGEVVLLLQVTSTTITDKQVSSSGIYCSGMQQGRLKTKRAIKDGKTWFILRQLKGHTTSILSEDKVTVFSPTQEYKPDILMTLQWRHDWKHKKTGQLSETKCGRVDFLE